MRPCLSTSSTLTDHIAFFELVADLLDPNAGNLRHVHQAVLAGHQGQSYAFLMAIPVEKIAEVALALPSDARALLADRLVESLDPLTDEDVRDQWIAEALRRRDEVRSGEVKTIPADEVIARLRALVK